MRDTGAAIGSSKESVAGSNGKAIGVKQSLADDDLVKKNKSKKTKLTAKEKAANKVKEIALKQKQLEFFSRMSIDTVVLDEMREKILTIGGVILKKINLDCMKAFVRNNKIQVPQDERKLSKLPKLIINHIKAGPAKLDVIAGIRKKAGNCKTKPKCLTKDGTIYRAIIVITCSRGSPYFKETKGALDGAALDARSHHPVAWDNLLRLYSLEHDKEFKTIKDGEIQLMGYQVDMNISSQYDKELSSDQMRELVLYIQGHYREARNAKNKSGNHCLIAKHVGGKPWLIYFHTRLVFLGDTALMTCAYPDLPSGAIRTSDQPNDPRNRGSGEGTPRSTATERTCLTSPTNLPLSTLARKKHEVIARIGNTALEIELKYQEERQFNKQEHFFKVKNNLHIKEEALMVVRDDIEDYVGTSPQRKTLKRKKKHLKTSVKLLRITYMELKKDLKYESASDSSDSDDHGQGKASMICNNKSGGASVDGKAPPICTNKSKDTAVDGPSDIDTSV